MRAALVRHIAVAAALTALSGCAVVALISMEPEQRAALFVVPADKAVIYFYRDEANDDALPLVLSVDGNAVAETRPSKFLFYEVEPGRHVVESWGALSDSVTLDAKAGNLYFVGQEVACDAAQMRLHLHAVNVATGKARVKALYAAGKIPAADGAGVAGRAVVCPSADEDAGGTRL